jgi:hypothetical protein
MISTRGRRPCAECPRELELLEAIAIDRVDRMRDHLASCSSCAGIADIAVALREEHDAALREARVPSAGAVWWRATIRARAEAARTVAQPITVAQGVAGACALGTGAAFIGVVWRAMASLGGVSNLMTRFDVWRDDLSPGMATVLQHALPLTLGLAACLVIAPVALYIALSDE